MVDTLQIRNEIQALRDTRDKAEEETAFFRDNVATSLSSVIQNWLEALTIRLNNELIAKAKVELAAYSGEPTDSVTLTTEEIAATKLTSYEIFSGLRRLLNKDWEYGEVTSPTELTDGNCPFKLTFVFHIN